MAINDQRITTVPVIADVTVSQTKVTGKAEGTISRLGGIEAMKNFAVADAIQKANADVLHNAHFTVVQHGKRATVTATGFPGTYQNFRPLPDADMNEIVGDYVRMGQLNKAQEIEKTSPEIVRVTRRFFWF
jgi:hypothetical protein